MDHAPEVTAAHLTRSGAGFEPDKGHVNISVMTSLAATSPSFNGFKGNANSDNLRLVQSIANCITQLHVQHQVIRVSESGT